MITIGGNGNSDSIGGNGTMIAFQISSLIIPKNTCEDS